MKIVVTASGGELTSAMDPRFGRCQYFVFYDTDAKQVIEVLDNPAMQAAGGAGIQAGQLIASKGVQAVLTGNVGPNASNVLSGAGVQVFTGMSGTVQDAIDTYLAGSVTPSAGPTVGSKAGMGGAAAPPPSSPTPGPGTGAGGGMGQGGGGGMGAGGGMGQGGGGGMGAGGGMGQGGGRGMGGGMGQGGGRGMGGGRGGGVGRGRGFGAGPPADCVCPSCGQRIAHTPGTPCRSMKCPKCNCVLVRGD